MTVQDANGPVGAAVFRKAYLTGNRPDIRVPVREVMLTTGDTFALYDTSGPHTDPAHAGGDVLPPLRAPWIAERNRAGGITQRGCARRGEITPEMEFAALREGVGPGAGAGGDRRGPGGAARLR